MIFHMCGCVTLLTDAGRVSPGVLLEISRCECADKLRGRAALSSRCALLSILESPPSCCSLWVGEDLSGPAGMMRAF